MPDLFRKGQMKRDIETAKERQTEYIILGRGVEGEKESGSRQADWQLVYSHELINELHGQEFCICKTSADWSVL